MANASEETLKALLPLLRQLREIKGVREVRPGVLQHRNSAFIQIVENDGVASAELRKAGAGGFDRLAIDTPAAQRKLVDEAKRRAARGDED